MLHSQFTRPLIHAVTFLTVCVFGVNANSNEPLRVPVETKLQACSTTVANEARLACFDALAKSLVSAKSEPSDRSASLPENLGGGKFNKSETQRLGNQGQVTSCKPSHDGRWFFMFDNGQIWKQVNLDRRRTKYKNCDFSVVIKKDGFGYKMHIESLAKVVRVKRHQ